MRPPRRTNDRRVIAGELYGLNVMDYPVVAAWPLPERKAAECDSIVLAAKGKVNHHPYSKDRPKDNLPGCASRQPSRFTLENSKLFSAALKDICGRARSQKVQSDSDTFARLYCELRGERFVKLRLAGASAGLSTAAKVRAGKLPWHLTLLRYRHRCPYVIFGQRSRIHGNDAKTARYDTRERITIICPGAAVCRYSSKPLSD